MKVVQSVQALYSSKQSLYTLLKLKTDEFIRANKKDEWHYIGRIKELESFTLKIETGRFTSLEAFEDLFACTLVVQNLTAIQAAIKFVSDNFVVRYQRPMSATFTHKESYAFPFDDLRMYVSLKDVGLGDLSPQVYDLIFEVQIKTFLQHAWTIATHDLIYKSDKINWSKERVAYQVKAALEHAEVSISGVDDLSKVGEISKENKEVKKVNQMIAFLNRYWTRDDLPKDKRRLAQNIISLISALEINQTELAELLIEETRVGRGTNTRDLSPYLIVVQSLFNAKAESMLKYLRAKNGGKQKILITKELTLPQLNRINKGKIIDLTN